MLLCELLRPDLIKVNLEAENKNEAIGELVDLLVQQHEIGMAQRAEIIGSIQAREQILSSGMEKGIAVPHGASDRVEDILCALGTAPKGIPFDTLDGGPADLVILLVLPRRNFTGEVRALAGIERLLEHQSLKAEIVATTEPGAIFKLIESVEYGGA